MIGARFFALSSLAFSSLALFLGCAPQAAEVPPVAPPIETNDASIVWWNVGESQRSAWVESEGEGFRVRAERAEAVMPAPSSLWAFRRALSERVTLCPSCECLLGQAEPTDDCRPRHENSLVHAMVRLGDGALIGFPSDATNEDDGTTCVMTEFERTVSLDGSAGSVVVLARHDSAFACSAHGNDFDQVRWLDLATGKPMPAPAPEEPRASEASAAAFAQIKADPRGCGSDVTSADVELYAAHLAYEADGTVGVEYEYAAPSTYVCGTGPGHYTTSTRIPATELPPGVVGHVPRYIARFVATLPKDAQLGGIGTVDRSLLETFVKSPTPKP